MPNNHTSSPVTPSSTSQDGASYSIPSSPSSPISAHSGSFRPIVPSGVAPVPAGEASAGTIGVCYAHPEDIIRGSDEFRAREDWSGLGRYLEQWNRTLSDAGDRRAQLSILNELLGYYRIQGREDMAMNTFDECVRLVFELDLQNSFGGCMILMNAATVLSAFNRKRQALELFLQVQTRMERLLPENDVRLSGLYNNLAGAYLAMANLSMAETCYLKSVDLLEKSPRERVNLPVILLNLASLYRRCGGVRNQRKCESMIDRAMALFNADDAVYDSAYAYNCRKCAVAMGELDRPDLQRDLNGRADVLYERD